MIKGVRLEKYNPIAPHPCSTTGNKSSMLALVFCNWPMQREQSCSKTAPTHQERTQTHSIGELASAGRAAHTSQTASTQVHKDQFIGFYRLYRRYQLHGKAHKSARLERSPAIGASCVPRTKLGLPRSFSRLANSRGNI